MITSTSNHLIKSIRKLADKKYRALSGLALVEGTKLVLDAIEQQAVIDKLLISASFERSNKRFFVNSKIAERPGFSIYHVKRKSTGNRCRSAANLA
jgi:tRNA G18 (ribose-2'-O)-methylase SpoU